MLLKVVNVDSFVYLILHNTVFPFSSFFLKKKRKQETGLLKKKAFS